MTSSVPENFAWPLLAFMATVTLLRYLFFNHSQWERYLNHTLAFMLASNLLREHRVEIALSDAGVLSITAAQQVSLALMIFCAAEFMGFITVYTRLSRQQARIRQRYHRIAALVAAAGVFVAATPARNAGQTLEDHGGWWSVAAWSIYVSILVTLGTQLMWMCTKELMQPRAKRHERMLALSGFSIGLSIWISSIEAPLLAALEEFGLLYSRDYRTALHGFIFFAESVGANLLAFSPFLVGVASRAGLDATSRHWRQLQPLRDRMLEAVPAIAFDISAPRPSGRRKAPMDLHQTVVQIRDAILQLRGYFRDVSDIRSALFVSEHRVPVAQREPALAALQLADALRAKAAGAAAVPVDSGAVLRSRANTLEDETAELLRLARWWSHAEHAASIGQPENVSATRAADAEPTT